MDVVEGKGPSPRLVNALIARLPDDSMTHALMHGGAEHLGWGMDRHLAAGIFDSIQQNTVATGSWRKGKAPKPASWPRPKAKRPAAFKPKKRSVAQLYASLPTSVPTMER